MSRIANVARDREDGDVEMRREENPRSVKRTQRPYRTPRLRKYGQVSELTAGGSGSANENSSGQLKRP